MADHRTERRKQQDADGQAAAADRIGNLMGLEEPPPARDPHLDVVGWMQWSPATMKGVHHRCLDCQPTKPGKGYWEPVTRGRLAATMHCTVPGCRRKLETVKVP